PAGHPPSQRSAWTTSVSGRRVSGPNLSIGQPTGISAHVETSSGMPSSFLTSPSQRMWLVLTTVPRPETAAGEKNVLHGRIDAGAANALGIGGLLVPERGDVWRQCFARGQNGAV